MPELKHLAVDDVDGILAALEEDGACVARDVLSGALCESLVDDFAPHLAAVESGQDDLGYRDNFYGARTRRLHGLFSRSPRMVEVLIHPLFLALAQRRLVTSGVARDVRLSNAELMVIYGGQTAQVFHTDVVSWQRAQNESREDVLVSANCALTEFTETNGATRVVPGSHRWPAGREPADDEVCLATMPRGAALIYLGRAVHSGGESRSDEPRFGLYLGYAASWLKPLENHLVTNDPADVHALPEAARRLLDVVPGGFEPYA